MRPRLRGRDPGRVPRDRPAPRVGEARRAPPDDRAGARQPRADRLGRRTSPPRPGAARRPGVRRLRPRRPRPPHRLDAVLPHLGAVGHVPADPRRRRRRRDGAQPLRRRPGDARAAGRRALGDRERRGRPLAGRRRRRRHRRVLRRGARASRWRRCTRCASRWTAAATRPNLRAGRLRRPARPAACRTTSAPSPSPPATASSERAELFKARQRRLRRDPVRRPVRPPGRGVRRDAARACAARAVGLRARRAADQRRAGRRGLPGHPPRPRLRLPARPHREAHDLRAARRAAARRHHADRELRDAARLVGVSGLYLSHPQARYFGVGRIGTRPARGLRGAQGLDARRGASLAGADPRHRRIAARPSRPPPDRRSICAQRRLNRRSTRLRQIG